MKIGDYVRTKSGGIGKIITINTNACIPYIITDNETFGLGWDKEQVNWDFRSEIIKSSPNIINLIEVGDYVNGYLVKYVDDNGVYIDIPFVDSESIGCNVDLIITEEIKSIITKEQFERVEYRV